MKDIKNYEGLYGITSCGRVWSYRRQKFLKPRVDKYGYLTVCLSNQGQKKFAKIHRLVAEAYIPNPEEKPQVNHKDENKANNSINNLEWATGKENLTYGTRLERIAKKLGKQVYCVELDRVFDSASQAARELDIDNSAISATCRGKYQTYKGYHWRYVDG